MKKLTTNIFLIGLFVLFAPILAFAQPNFTKNFTPDNIGPGNITTLTYTIYNSNEIAIDQIAFTDNLPTGILIATPSNASISSEGTLNVSDGGTTIELTRGRLVAGANCTITIDIVATGTPSAGSPIVLTSTTGDLTSSDGNSGTASDELTIAVEKPSFSLAFSPPTLFAVGQKSRLTYTIDNTLNPSSIGTFRFSNNLPAGIQIAEVPNAITDCENENPSFFPTTITANPNESIISLNVGGFNSSGFYALQAGATCTVAVDVVGTSIGEHINTTEELFVDNQSAGKATGVLEVQTNTLDVLFLDNPVAPGGSTTLEFTIHNRDRSNSLTAIAFTNDLASTLAGLTFSSLVSNDCGGTVGGMGTTNIDFSGGTVAAGSSCTCQVEVTVPTTAVSSDYTNTTSSITGMLGGAAFSGNMGQDILTVFPAPILTQVFMNDPVSPGDPVDLEFTVTNTSTTSSATDITFENIFPDIIQFASVVPGNDCVGAGSTCTFTAGNPARLTITGGTLAPAGMPGDNATFSITLDVVPDATSGTYESTTPFISATVDGATRSGIGASDDLIIEAAPSLSISFEDAAVAPGQTTNLECTLTHSANASGPATGITFSNDLNAFIAGMTGTLPSNPDPACGTGSSLTGSAGDALLTFMNGTLNPGESCTFSVAVNIPLSAATGNFTNITSTVSATINGATVTSAEGTADLLISPLKVTQEFIGNPALPGEQVTLRFHLENLSTTDDITGIVFTDNLGTFISGTVAGVLPSTPCGPSSSISGTNFLIFTGGSLAAGTSCSFDIPVNIPLSTSNDTYANTTSNISSMVNGNTVTNNPISATLEIRKERLSITKEFTDDPVLVGTSGNIRYTIKNLDADNTITDIAFTDDLDGTLTGLVATGLPQTAICGAGAMISGTGLLSFTGGSLGPDEACQFDVAIAVPAGATPADYPSPTSEITGLINTLPVNGSATSDDLTVTDLEITFTKAFDGPTTPGGTPTLTYTLTNLSTTQSIDNLKFSDDLEAVLSGLVATDLPKSDICGEGTTLNGTSLITFIGGSLAPETSCSFSVALSVPSNATPGTLESTSAPLTINGLAITTPAIADLVIEVATFPDFSKAFSESAICQGETTTLTFTIDNSARNSAETNLSFTDNLPAGMVIATTPNAMISCTGGTLTAVAGSGIISYTGGAIAASGTCTIQVDVTGNNTGILMNTSGDLTSSAGNSGTATASLTVNGQPLITGQNAAICNGESIDLSILLTGTPANTLEYGTSLSIFGLTKEVMPTNNTTYYVRDSNTTTMCVDTAKIVVTVNDQPLITGQNVTICNGEPIDLSTLLIGTPLNTLEYGTSLNTFGLTKEVMPTSNITYFVRDSNATLMCADTAQIIVAVIPNPSGTPLSGSETFCGGINNSATLSLVNPIGTVEKWQSANNPSFTNPSDITEVGTSLLLTNVTTTTYYRAVFLNNNCSNVFSATAAITIDKTDSDGDTVYDCIDVCPGGDDRINTDGTGMPDDCDCNPTDPNDEFIVENGIPEIGNVILPGTYQSSFELKSEGMVSDGINVEFVAGHQIILETGFTASSGSGFIARIERCDELNTFSDDPVEYRSQALTSPSFDNLELSVIPNPFNDYATISFSLDHPKNVSLRLYNQSGQMVQSIYQHQLTDAGYHEASVNTAHLPEGLYLFSLSIDGKIITKRTILAR